MLPALNANSISTYVIRLLLIAFICTTVVSANAQDSSLATIGGILDAYFEAAEEADSNQRYAAFSKLFTDNGQITAIIQSGQKSKVLEGSWRSYLSESDEYYRGFEAKFLEQEREMEYYLELASVHCTVTHLSRAKDGSKTFQQELWMQFNLVFIQNRWFIDNVLWINALPQTPIDRALQTDTLIYAPD